MNHDETDGWLFTPAGHAWLTKRARRAAEAIDGRRSFLFEDIIKFKDMTPYFCVLSGWWPRNSWDHEHEGMELPEHEDATVRSHP